MFSEVMQQSEAFALELSTRFVIGFLLGRFDAMQALHIGAAGQLSLQFASVADSHCSLIRPKRCRCAFLGSTTPGPREPGHFAFFLQRGTSKHGPEAVPWHIPLVVWSTDFPSPCRGFAGVQPGFIANAMQSSGTVDFVLKTFSKAGVDCQRLTEQESLPWTSAHLLHYRHRMSQIPDKVDFPSLAASSLLFVRTPLSRRKAQQSRTQSW